MKKDGCGTLYSKYLTEVLRKQVQFCRKDNITLRPGQRNVLSRSALPSMTMKYLQIYYEEVRSKLTRFRDRGNMWMEIATGIQSCSSVLFSYLLIRGLR